MPHPVPDPPEPIDPAIEYFRNTTLNAWRGKVIDFIDSDFKPGVSDWAGTKESVLVHAEDEYLRGQASLSAKHAVLGELQTNIMVKLYKLNDPHGESDYLSMYHLYLKPKYQLALNGILIE